MKRNMILKIAADFCMAAALTALMAYELVGRAVHEWIGVFLFGLFILHHIWNAGWIRKKFQKGRGSSFAEDSAGIRKHTRYQMLKTFLVICVFITMAGSLISGVILSHHVFAFLPITGGHFFARNLHMVSAYWGFVFIALHFGFHWSMIMGAVKKHWKNRPSVPGWILRGIAFLAALYGACAFGKRRILDYMFLRSLFVFFDFEEPLAFFLADYTAVFVLFVWCGHYLSKWASAAGKSH